MLLRFSGRMITLKNDHLLDDDDDDDDDDDEDDGDGDGDIVAD